MGKISTQQIRNLIPKWFNESGATEYFRQRYDNDDEGEEGKRYFTKAINPQQWKRTTKSTVGKMERASEPQDLEYDVAGYRNDAKLDTMNESELKRCVYRRFNPADDYIANNFDLEVVTDPSDQEVLFWSIHED